MAELQLHRATAVAEPYSVICEIKYSFTNRVVNIWNSLPNKVVLADSVSCFKSRLDKFWQNQDIVYNFRAEIEGTRNRSEV